ncbi:xanthine dehydrogenase family protein molybdopterin-binding subunit [Teichococcus vastitatis]|uniref:Xanthine dehydrogenase family protein molybdopterin-binding subunit n=1 Tax=Teichococcus vastitatis TaxID=2307076 RepID=A0ABS9W8F6_9PROT|nr:xanthine dehydrogenase family protein molybdopterin-binding subunit [Pseudoroseomonas vastitatis]MCI0755577.1 xanthine dehydrogenase family protein molybdopterin-binding subunit [Pseudoroseomonas vastitatis]
MNVPFDTFQVKYGIGQPVSRKEDPVLLRGEGRYSDDLNLPGQLYAVMVRSPYAHAVLRGIDATEAKDMPGVLAIYTGQDLAAADIGPMLANVGQKNRDGTDVRIPRQMPLTIDRVRYVGEPVAMVIAETAKQARDAAEAVVLDVGVLPAVTEAREAGEATPLYDEVPGNLLLDYHYGDAEKVAGAFARAAHVTRLPLRNNRIVVAPMEPRSALASFEAEELRFILRLGTQGVFGMRNNIAKVMGVEPAQLRVLTGNVGGSFGMKASVYPEYISILYAARALGRPVKWTDERSESFLSDSHGRDHDLTGELALDAEGHFLAVRMTGFANLGAYLSNATVIPPTSNTVKNVVGVYRTPLVEVSTRCMFTNTTPVGAYRGAGRPEGNYYMERLVSAAAREMGIDPIELRRRNHIQPAQIPYATPAGTVYDSGEFPAVLDEALVAADWDGFSARRAESRRQGKLRGRGIGHYLEVTAPPSKEMGGIRFEVDGTVTIITGTLDYGQGHASPFAQVLVDRLGIPFDRIKLVQGDSDELIAGGGTGGSRSIMASGTAIAEASALVIEKGRQLAGHLLEAALEDIEFSAGRFHIAGTDRGIDILDLAARLRMAPGLPDDLPRSLDVEHADQYEESAFPNGCHIAEVEIDPETGMTSIDRYVMVNDFGVLINPMLVEGQAHGGVVQGIGQALTELTAYDPDGQLLSGSFMDYGLPRAVDTPSFSFQSRPVPARTNVLGAKGCGEAGCAGALPAVMNAVVDALAEVGVNHIDMPATPARIWQAIQAQSSDGRHQRPSA